MTTDRDTFRRLAERATAVPLVCRLMSDQFTPVLAYRRLVAPDERTAPSFLFESVEDGRAVGRYSFIGSRPSLEVVARAGEVTVTDHRTGAVTTTTEDDPLEVLRSRSLSGDSAAVDEASGSRLPGFRGGWVGYAGYDAVRYLEPEKLPFAAAAPDDRHLPDLHFGLYRQVGVFDHVQKVLSAINWVVLDEHTSVDAAWEAGRTELDEFVDRLQGSRVLPPGAIDLDLAGRSPTELESNFTRAGFEAAVERAREYIGAGDAFQIVLSQRFTRRTTADPFEIYRALRIVNPSPYMIYLQAEGSILVAASPEILCRCQGGVVTNRPLAGTRPRGSTPEKDRALEEELLNDRKERSEHVMLVDLGRNDIGRVSTLASVRLERVMAIERYSHVMHLSSTVAGRLRAGLDTWDALRGTLPVGTVSGAPKIRAMQIIDELEPTRRGPYAGGIGYVSVGGEMDMAIALRTMVIPTGDLGRGGWTVHLQAGAGIVIDSDPASEYEETVSKAAALNRAIDLAETAFTLRAREGRDAPASGR